MTQPNLLALAKQGNADAIATLMNRALQPRGITAKVTFKNDCLRVLFEGEQVPNEEDLANFAFRGVLQLELESAKVIKVFGRQEGEELPAWSRELDVDTMLRNFNTLLEEPLDQVEPTLSEQPQPSDIQCPRCRSTQLLAHQKGFSYGQAAVGSLFGTGAALATGMIGSDEVILTCLQCNYRWELAKGHFRINPNPQPVDAKLETLDKSVRLGCGFIGSGVLFLLGLLIAALGGMQISIYIWGFALVVLLGFLVGVDDWTKSLSGACPYCGNTISATVTDTTKTCERCNHRLSIRRTENKNYKFYP